ncbi:cation-translocating P-type ATPase, partial [Clostridium botulinum]|nr:cation-translocating P-type ATPase [Clostridium botulinum]
KYLQPQSITQGLVLFLASFGTYYIYLMNNPNASEIARSMGLTIIMISNLLLVQVNNSSKEYVYKSFSTIFKDKIMLLILIGTVIGIGVILYTPLANILKLASLSFVQIITVVIISVISVMWYEIVKVFKNKKQKN